MQCVQRRRFEVEETKGSRIRRHAGKKEAPSPSLHIQRDTLAVGVDICIVNDETIERGT